MPQRVKKFAVSISALPHFFSLPRGERHVEEVVRSFDAEGRFYDSMVWSDTFGGEKDVECLMIKFKTDCEDIPTRLHSALLEGRLAWYQVTLNPERQQAANQ